MQMKKNCLKIVIGLGKTGLSCVRYLVKQGFNVAVVDSRENPPGLAELNAEFPVGAKCCCGDPGGHPHVDRHFGKFDIDYLSLAETIIISPGVSLLDPTIAKLIKCGIPVIGDIELFVQAAKAPIVAITGSNGKSTVTTLVGEMAKKAGINVKVGGNLGTPALELLDDKAELYVMELSSFQLDTTFSLKAKAAAVLNVTPDHMDRYENFAAYLASKLSVYKNCEFAIINRDESVIVNNCMGKACNNRSRGMACHVQNDSKNLDCTFNALDAKKIISFGLQNNDDLPNTLGIEAGYIKYANKKLFKINELKIKGLHNVTNAMAALALGYANNLPETAMIQTLKEFPGLSHRCEWVRRLNDVCWYNDSKGTNIGATEASIKGLGEDISGKIILIAGGQGKGADFSLLKDTVAKYVRTVILIGEDAKLIANALQNVCELIYADSMQVAVNFAADNSKAGDVVLLSPACASFDMFKNFEHRGEVFKKCVKELVQKF